jgi:acetyl esterase/lipase
VTTLKAVETGLHAYVKAQILIVPVCDNTATLESDTWSQRPHAPLLIAELMAFYRDLYLGPQHSPTRPGEHWTASPVRAPQDLLRGCPKTIMILAREDLLYPEAIQFAKKLRKEGVDVDVETYDGVPHPFVMMDRRLPSGRQAILHIIECVKKILAECVEDSSDIKPSDVNNERDRQNLLEQAKWSCFCQEGLEV